MIPVSKRTTRSDSLNVQAMASDSGPQTRKMTIKSGLKTIGGTTNNSTCSSPKQGSFVKSLDFHAPSMKRDTNSGSRLLPMISSQDNLALKDQEAYHEGGNKLAYSSDEASLSAAEDLPETSLL